MKMYEKVCMSTCEFDMQEIWHLAKFMWKTTENIVLINLKEVTFIN
jgi:hypothetical protein